MEQVWFKIEKAVHRDYILSPCLFKCYAEYIMQNAGLDDSQVGIKIAWRNINNLIYANNTTLKAESKEELKSLLMKVEKESGNRRLKTQYLKKQRSWHLVPSLQANRWGKSRNSDRFYFLGHQNLCRW